MIEYLERDEKDLDTMAALWDKLRLHHRERSQHFAADFDKMTWETRRQQLLDKCRNGGVMLVHTARDDVNGEMVGYCVSTVDEHKAGELESIYVEKEYRGRGIGDTFIKQAVRWMDGLGAKRKVIAVAAGNEEVFGFYAKYGFYTRVSVLIQAEAKE